MGIKLVLDDHDIDVLEDVTGEDFSRFRDAGAIKAFRSRSIETICRVLNREPGDVLKLTDEEPPELGDAREVDTDGQKCSWKTYAVITAVFILVVFVVIGSIALRVG